MNKDPHTVIQISIVLLYLEVTCKHGNEPSGSVRGGEFLD